MAPANKKLYFYQGISENPQVGNENKDGDASKSSIFGSDDGGKPSDFQSFCEAPQPSTVNPFSAVVAENTEATYFDSIHISSSQSDKYCRFYETCLWGDQCRLIHPQKGKFSL